jgi:hypothetical protein
MLNPVLLNLGFPLFVPSCLGLFCFPEKSFLFAVQTAAVLLAIQPQVFGRLDPLLPPRAKIFIKKRYPHGFADGIPHGFYDVMLLKFAVQQGRGKIIEFAAFGQQGRGSQAVVIAVVAAVLFPVNHILNKPFQIIAFLEDYPKIDLIGVRL